jgi:hypothetical protein
VLKLMYAEGSVVEIELRVAREGLYILAYCAWPYTNTRLLSYL